MAKFLIAMLPGSLEPVHVLSSIFSQVSLQSVVGPIRKPPRSLTAARPLNCLEISLVLATPLRSRSRQLSPGHLAPTPGPAAGTRRGARLIGKPQRSFPQISDTEDYEDDGVEYGFRWREDGFRYLIHK